MATLVIDGLDEQAYKRLKQQARVNNRSPEAEARAQLERRADSADIVADLLAFHRRMVAKHGYLPDSTDTLRAMRREE